MELKNVRIYIQKFMITAVGNVTMFGNALIIKGMDIEGGKYGKVDPDLVILGDRVLRDKEIIVVDVSTTTFTDNFLKVLMDTKKFDDPNVYLDRFKNNAEKIEEDFWEVGRYIKVYLEEFHINIKASIHVVGRNYCLNWFSFEEGVLGEAKDPYLTVPASVKFLKQGSVITCAREGCIITEETE